MWKFTEEALKNWCSFLFSTPRTNETEFVKFQLEATEEGLGPNISSIMTSQHFRRHLGCHFRYVSMEKLFEHDTFKLKQLKRCFRRKYNFGHAYVAKRQLCDNRSTVVFIQAFQIFI